MEKRTSSADIKPFTFNSLEVASDTRAESFQSFEFRDFSKSGATTAKKPSEKIIRAEREAEVKTQFRMDAIVRDLRGLTSQEKDDLEKKINEQVDQRLKETREKAYREGLEKGRLEGVDAALKEAMQAHERQITEVENMLVDLRSQCEARLESHRHDIYEMTKRLMKWLVLKEIGDDSYLPKLLEKLVLVMNQRHSLIIRVNPQDFQAMPQIVAEIEKRIGALPNVRVEPDLDMKGRGLVLESENGILDGTPEAIFETIDKMYETVVNHG